MIIVLCFLNFKSNNELLALSLVTLYTSMSRIFSLTCVQPICNSFKTVFVQYLKLVYHQAY